MAEKGPRKGGREKVKKAHKEPRYNTGTTMKELWLCLVRDFRSALSDPSYMQLEELALRRTVAEYRGVLFPRRYLAPTAIVKMDYQLESLFKRFKFTDDVYSDSELENITIQKFLDTQKRIGTQRVLPYRATLVIRRARQHAARILGKYSTEEHYISCKFGSRAAKGVSLREAGLDQRLSAMTGSAEHIAWFKDYVRSDDNLRRAILSAQGRKAKQEIEYTECETLRMAVVPKSWKANRTIMPNTNIGGFWSYGIGRMIQRRLASEGLNIRRLQDRHRMLARKYSETRTHATADLSSASDSFTTQLVMMLLPREWWRVVRKGRIDRFTVDGDTEPKALISFMTMGLGYTFQLQTLLFYCILCAIRDLLGVKGRISVYGDDLIYPSPMHEYVAQTFADIGFILNKEKTYVKENFRESCGADCYCGTDVRPFQPEGTAEDLPGKRYLAFLYKTINGLLRRWPKEEIPRSYHYLLTEVLRVDDGLMQVPPSYPDYSGIKVGEPQDPTAGEPFYPITDEVDVAGKPFTFGFVFRHLRLTVRDRVVADQRSYYWNALRGAFVSDYDAILNDPKPLPLNSWRSMDELLDETYEEPIAPLKWVWKKIPLRTNKFEFVRSCRKLQKGENYEWELLPFTTERSPGKYDRHSSTTSCWN